MNRREFIKLLMAASAALAIPYDAQTEADETIHRNYNPEWEWGVALPILARSYDSFSNDDILFMVQQIKDNAAKHLPKGTPCELRLKFPTNFGTMRGIAWYSFLPEFSKKSWLPCKHEWPGVPDEFHSHLLLERFYI